ncbi:MAG: hypothetical protein JWO36_3019 [Myxococcales bacterium]|nr:hypothetical protein [Myxococcales bacterium]
MSLVYKFVEISIVTDESIEEAVNAWVSRGWQWDSIKFVTTEASRRPQMAFISFVREVRHEQGQSPGQGQGEPPPPGSGPRLVKSEPGDERE